MKAGEGENHTGNRSQDCKGGGKGGMGVCCVCYMYLKVRAHWVLHLIPKADYLPFDENSLKLELCADISGGRESRCSVHARGHAPLSGTGDCRLAWLQRNSAGRKPARQPGLTCTYSGRLN